MSESSNITIRLGINGGTDSPLTYEQLDTNFLELKSVIDDYNDHINSENPHDAIFIYYDNENSSLSSSDIQSALDEVDANVVNMQNQITTKLDKTSFEDHIDSNTAHNAVDIVYDNSNSTIQQDDVNAAIDQLDANYNANDVLNKIKSVDGSGSGLDADTVDGSQASELRDRSNHTGTQPVSTVTGLHPVATSGDYNSLENTPDLSILEEVLVFPTDNDFPVQGEFEKVFIASDTGYIYRWNGSGYTQLTDQTAIWGNISGSLNSQTDLTNALNDKASISGQAFTGNISAPNLPIYQTATVMLGGDFGSQTVEVTRIGNVVTVGSKTILTHSSKISPNSDEDILPSWAASGGDRGNLYYLIGNDLLSISINTTNKLILEYSNSRTDSHTAPSITYIV